MGKNASGALTKVTAKIFDPVYVEFDRQMTRSMLKRDAFLDRVISVEIPHLRNNLKGKQLSPRAKKYISGCLKSMGGAHTAGLRAVNVSLTQDTADALREVVSELNLQRDAFLNWLIVLLRSTDQLLERLDLPLTIKSSYGGCLLDTPPISPLRAIEDIEADPLYYLRTACEEIHGHGLYSFELPEAWHGFACYLPDSEVPGTAEYERGKGHGL